MCRIVAICKKTYYNIHIILFTRGGIKLMDENNTKPIGKLEPDTESSKALKIGKYNIKFKKREKYQEDNDKTTPALLGESELEYGDELHNTINLNEDAKTTSFDSETIKKKAAEDNMTKNNSPKKKPKKKKPKKKASVFKKVLITLIILIVLVGIVGVGILATIMLQAPDLDFNKFDYASTTTIYDINGDEYQRLQGIEQREPVQIEDVPELVQLAFIAVEDQRYYSHHGVDLRGTAKAVLSVLTSGSTDGPGGSTITQQLIKLTHLTSEVSITRKVMEWKLAYELENQVSKRDIMGAYLNKVNMSLTWGIQSAAQTYFGCDVSELSLAQTATLASIINAPTFYNPYKYIKDEDGNRYIEKIKNEDGSITIGHDQDNMARSLEIIGKMKYLGYINEQEYEIAKDELENNKIGLIFPEVASTYSYFTDAVYEQVMQDIMDKYNYTYSNASDLLLNGGLKIYSTIDPVIQDSLDNQVANNDNFPSPSYEAKSAAKAMSKKLGEDIEYLPQVGGAIIQNETGYVSAIAGGREKVGNLTLNRGLRKFQIGSTAKPLTVYSAGIDTGKITMGSTFNNIKLNFGGWKVVNTPAVYNGMTSAREGIRTSINIVAVLAQSQVGIETSSEYAKKYGFELTENDYNPAAMALGGYTYGQTPLALASAYTVFPNGGYRVTPTFYTRVENSNGVTILTPPQETVQVISEETAFIVTDALKQVVRGGTTTRSLPGQQIGGKTGTTDKEAYTWFAGITPEYTGAFWYGYDEMHVTVNDNTYDLFINMGGGGYRSPAQLWERTFRQFYDEKNIKDAKLPSKPDGVIRATIDGVSGKAPTALSEKDPRGSQLRSEYFIKGFYPAESDDMHVECEVCKITGKLAGEFCPKETKVLIKKDPKKLYPPGTTEIGKQGAEAKYLVPTKECTLHKTANIGTGLEFSLSPSSNDLVRSIELEVGESITLYPKVVSAAGTNPPTVESPSYSLSGGNVAVITNSSGGVSITTIAGGVTNLTMKYTYGKGTDDAYTISRTITINVKDDIIIE